MRKRLALLLLLTLVSLLCFGATTTLKNQSGATASGVVITFSEAVRITSYDKSVFPTQSPASGEAELFTFSGGALAAGGTFQVTWSPSGARVRSSKWITPGSTTAASTASIPTTYEEIMAQIAHYPGPEEPLYVASEGEAIWLTDLEGHTDIYDNDSIKINYTPSFDKSQVTRIDVYRNGIKMRFLPDELDVLTNEEMKMFDGNPEEHTPKSSHTDHAIFGYEYQFSFLSVSQATPTALRVTIRNPFGYSGYRTLNIGTIFQALRDRTDEELVGRLRQYKDMGFQAAEIDIEYYLTSISADAFFPVYTVTPSIAGEWERTLTRDELGHILTLVSEAGLAAEVRVQLHVSKEWQAKHAAEGWLDRSDLRPPDVDTWFANYTQLCVDVARVAAEGRAELFCVAVELSSMEKHAASWRKLATDLRSAFPGRLTFDEATHLFLGQGHSGTIAFEAEAGHFWDAFDLIEFSCWPTAANQLPLESRDDQRFSVIVASFVRDWAKAFAYYRSAYPGMPIAYGEMGCYTQDGAAAGKLLGGPGRQPSVVDHQEMADVWAAGLIAASLLDADGVCVWALTPYCLPYEQACFQGQPGGFFLMASPALRTIESFFGR